MERWTNGCDQVFVLPVNNEQQTLILSPERTHGHDMHSDPFDLYISRFQSFYFTKFLQKLSR